MKKFKTSLLDRATPLVKIATSLVGNEIKERVFSIEAAKKLKNRIEITKEIAKELSELKGAAMKLGQLLSLETMDYLPPEAAEILGKLHKSAEPVDYTIIKTQIEGMNLDDVSKLDVDPSPIGVASIGQVHRAQYNDIQIVLKIQYPQIQKTVETDLKLVKFLFEKSSSLFKKDINLEPFLKEMKQTLMDETDYNREAHYLNLAKIKFENDPRFLVPKVIKELSTKEILAMEYMEGTPLSGWLNEVEDKEEVKRIGTNLFELFLFEFFELGLVQTDPNPGNFLVNSKGQIVLLDFGATKEYPKEFINSYLSILGHTYNFEKEKLIQTSIDFGLLDPRESLEVHEIFYDMMTFLIGPFRRNQKFSFKDPYFNDESRKLALNFSYKCRYSPPPEKILFLHRKLGGIFSLLKKMDLEINLHDYWREINR